MPKRIAGMNVAAVLALLGGVAAAQVPPVPPEVLVGQALAPGRDQGPGEANPFFGLPAKPGGLPE